MNKKSSCHDDIIFMNKKSSCTLALVQVSVSIDALAFAALVLVLLSTGQWLCTTGSGSVLLAVALPYIVPAGS